MYPFFDKAIELRNLGIPTEELIPKVRELLQHVERYILNVTGSDPIRACGHRWLDGNTGDINESEEYRLVEDLLLERSALMNMLFKLHCSDAELERLKLMNDHLFKLTTDLHRKIAHTYRVLLASRGGDEFTDDINIDGIIHYSCESGQDYVQLEDDGFYGSNFPQMLAVLSATENDNCAAIVDAGCSWSPDEHSPEMSDEQLGVKDNMNDGTSWHEGFEDVPRLKDVVFCHAVHDICSHRSYSIPDLLRMNFFWSEVKVAIQNLRETDGSHPWWYNGCTLQQFKDKFLAEAEHRPAGMSLAAFIRRRLNEYFTREWFETEEKLAGWPRFTSDEDAMKYLEAVWKGLQDVYEKSRRDDEIRKSRENESGPAE